MITVDPSPADLASRGSIVGHARERHKRLACTHENEDHWGSRGADGRSQAAVGDAVISLALFVLGFLGDYSTTDRHGPPDFHGGCGQWKGKFAPIGYGRCRFGECDGSR